MSLLKALASIGIQRTDLSNITSQDVIRIQKKLTAELKLGGSVTKNDIDQITKLLTEYPDVIEVLSGYECFWGILIDVEAEQIDTLRRYDEEKTLRIRKVIAHFFIEDITRYVVTNCSTNNWNNIGVLLYYRSFFTNEVMAVITNRLSSKLEYAIAIFQSGILDNKKLLSITYLTEREFFERLRQLNDDTIAAQVKVVAGYIGNNVIVGVAPRFFMDVGIAIREFYGQNAIVSHTYVEPSRQRSGWSYAVGIIVLIITVIRLISSVSGHRSNMTSEQYTLPYPIEEDRYDWPNNYNAQIKGFVEARSMPLNYPIQSWNATVLHMSKYINPFSLKMFSSNNYRDIKVGDKKVDIFNNTLKECVVLAYYTNVTNWDDGSVQNKLYALFLPPKDSLRINGTVATLRFYMGRRLAGFKASNDYYKPDSTDSKFSIFSPADLLLFSKGFDVILNDTSKNKHPHLIISQPSSTIYKIGWTGSFPLIDHSKHYGVDPNSHLDDGSITAAKPLILDARKTEKIHPYGIKIPSMFTFGSHGY